MAKSKYFTAADFKKPKTQTATKSKYFTAADFAKDTEASTTSKSKYFTSGDFAENIANNAINRINALSDNATTLVKDYESRFAGRKGNYEDAYVSDSADYLNTVTQQRDAYKQEYNDILSYLDKNAKYLNSEWVDSVKKSLTENDVASVYDQVVKAAEEDNAYWNSFGDGLSNKILKYATFGQYDAEAAYKTEQRKYGYYQKYQGKSLGELNGVLNNLEESPEKNWLTKYASSVENDELSKADIGVLKSELDKTQADWEALLAVSNKYRWLRKDDEGNWYSPNFTNEEVAEILNDYAYFQKKYGSDDPFASLTKIKNEKEQYIKDAEEIQEYNKQYEYYNDFTKNADFTEKSAYKTTYVGGEHFSPLANRYTVTGFDDITYDYINRNETARDRQNLTDIANYSSFTGTDKSYLAEMKNEEIAIYNYLYATNKSEAEKYLAWLTSDLNARQREREQEEWAADAQKHPIANSLFSVAISPLKILSAAGQVTDYLQDGKVDQNAGYNRFSYIPSAIRGQVANDIAESGKWGEVGSWTYQLGMSMGDFLMNSAVSGGSKALSLTLMGSGAMADTVISAKDRGLSDDQAMILGVVAGGAEIITEKFSLDALFKGNMSKGAMRYILTNAFTEGTEEVSSSLINTFADILVSKDKSEWAMAIEEYMANNPGASEREAFNKVLTDTALSLGLDFLGGSLMGGVMGSGGATINYAFNARPGIQENIDAVKQYGEFTNKLIEEGLLSDPDSYSYDLAKYYQKKTAKGKELSGYEIRSLVDANEKQFTVENAKTLLTELGETGNVNNLANLVAKYVSGQELTRAEKRTLTRSEHGAEVAKKIKEMASASKTEAENSTKAFDVARKDNTAAYKPLEEKVSNIYPTAESGKATIHDSNETVNLDKVEVVDFVKDKETGKVTDMVLKVDGKDVNASDIDFADDSQSYLYAAVSQIENITPGDAQVIIRNYDPSSGQTVGEYLNGMDEAYTFGYRGYNEAGLEKTDFASKLTDTQMNTAYTLGWSTKNANVKNKFEAIKKMRSEAESEKANAKKTAEGKKAKQSQKMTVSYDKGNGEIAEFSKSEMKKLSGEQRAGVAIAKILHKLGLGTNFEFFSSYLSDNIKVKDKKTGEMKAARVYVDENGAEVVAPAGVYRKSDGTIRIDLNAYNGKKLTLYAMAHELTHFIQQWSAEKYQALAEFLIKTYDKTDMSMHQRVIIEQARLQEIRGKEVSYDEAFDEVVANAMMKMLDDQNIAKTLAELKAQDANLAQKLISKIKELIDDFINALKEYKQYPYLFDDTKDIMALEKEFEQLKQMWAEALVEASENFQAAQEVGFEMDAKTESVSPAVMNSEQTWTESDYVQQRDKAAQEIAKAIGVSQKKAKDYIDSINSIAKMIAEDRSRLDYFSSPYRSSFVDNAEYGGSFDFSTLCKKRRLLTGTFTAIQKALPNTALTANEILDIRNLMKDAGLEVSCGLCYVEGSRANMGQFAKEFLRLYKQYYPDAWQPNMADVNTPDGIEWVRLNHPECYEQYEYFWNHYGTLKPGDKNLFASQQKPKLYQLHTEYKGEILNKFKNDDKVEDKNLNGGIRLQSFSDFEIVHLIDTMQIIMDMSRVGLAGQAYTKVPDFAWALGDTGLKINLSLIAKGVDADGKLVFDDVEGMPIADAMKLRDRYSQNVGTILVAFNDEQLLAAMADERVDFIIPFHRSQWKKSQYEAMGLPAKTKDYTYMQNEKFIKPQYHEYRGRMVKDKATNYMPNEYWDFSKSGKENAEAYLEMCARNNKRPKFYKLLQNNGDGSYSLKADGSTDGYWKLLIDFKMYDNDGVGSPQMAVKPEFNMQEATRMLNDYSGGHSNFPVAQGIVDGFVKDYKASHKGEQYSSQETDIDTDADFAYDGVKKKTAQEVNRNEIREETREAFRGRADKALLEVGERGTLTFGYRRYSGQLSQNIQAAEEGLKKIGIPVVVFERMEGNKNGITTIYSNDALAIPGVAVFIHKDAIVEALEIVGHEGYHYFPASGNRNAYNEVLAANVDFSSKAFIDYQQKYVGDIYFAEDVEIGSKEWNTLIEEAFAYITGDIHSGDPRGEVHKFLRDYDAVKTAWDDLIKKQTVDLGKDALYSSQETDADNAPIFYSKMGKVVEGMKQEKFGASSVISMLTGRGVKAEEIRWSGIHAFLDGKKSVTKTELQEFIAGSQLNIEEKVLDNTKPTNTEVKKVGWNKLGAFVNGELINTYTKGKDGWYESEKSGWHEIKNKKDLEELLAYKSKYLVGNKQRHSAFKLDGGKNYREVVFSIPGSSYSNPAMVAHWGKNAQGILAHARIQDFDVDGQKMLFVEEIQSDWHNEGHKQGYISDGQKFDSDIRNESADAYRDFHQSKVMQSVESKLDRSEYGGNVTKLISDLFDGDKSAYSDVAYYANLTTDERAFIDNAIADETKRQQELNKAPQASKKDSYVPDAPFKDNYHEFVLKRLLREAAEKGYDSIGWTTADIQSQRWSDEFAEGYRIEYDQDIPKFLKKYGKQWGAVVGKTTLKDGTEVWSMDITPAMKKSVLTEGQEMYSTQDTDIDSNRAMLANAFEGLSQNSEEYKMIQEYKEQIKVLNLLEDQLAKLNAQIWEIRFTKGKYDAKKLQALESKADRIAKDINKQDKTLLNMEASGPLRKVIEFERKKASQKTKEHLKQIAQNKKERAEQTEVRHKIRKTVRDLDKLLNRGNKKTNVKEDMKDFVSKALELADYLFTDHISNDDLIRKGITVRMTDKEAALVKETEDILSHLYDNADSLTDEEFARLDAKRKANEDKLRDLLTAQRNERLNTPVAKLFDDLVKAYASLKNSKQDAVKAAYSEELENSLRAMTSEDSKVKILENMRVADMTTEELNWLYRAYTMVLTNVRNANKAFANSGAATIEEISNKVYRDFSSRKIPEGKLAIAMQKLTNKMGWDYEKLYYALDRIGSEAFTELIMNLANSENIVMQDVIEAIEFRDKMVKEYGFNNWAVNKKIDKEFLDNTGKKFKLTLGQLMALYAYSRRDGAWDHIEYGGFVFGEASLTNPKPADAYKLTKAQCEAITDTLTKEQKAYVRDMQKYLSKTMGEKGNEVSMLLYGIKMFGEENYFPIHIAGQFKTQANESQAKAAAGFSTMSNAGFTHAQNPNAKAPFVLEGFNEIWVDHVNEMSRYHGTVPALEDIRRVMNRSSYSDAAGESVSIRQQMENSFGKEAVEYFDNLYREANSGAITDKLQRVPKKLLSLFRKNSVAYSLSVIIQQSSAMVRAYAMIDKKYFGFKGVGALTSGVAKAVSSKWNPAYANAYNEMLKYAPGVTMAKEIGGFDTHTGASIREYLLDTGKSFKQRMKTENLLGMGKAVLDLVDDNAIANLPNVVDKIAWIEIWNACKRETVAKHKDLATNSEEFMQIVGERFTEVIRATQVYDSIFAKSPMLKSKSLAVQYLVSFMNEANTTINMVEKSIRDATKGDWKGGMRIAAAVTGSIIFNNVLKGIIYAMRDDDEDETYIEKYLAAVTGGMMDDFNPINYIPIARDVWSKAKGFDVERPDVAIVSDAIDAYQAIAKYKGKDTEDMTEEEIAELDKKITDASWKLAGSLAAFFGIPVKNIYREIDAVIDHARIASANAGMTTASGVWDKVKEEIIDSIPFMNAPAKTDKLYDAIISGDKTYLERLKSSYKTDDAYQSAVRKALRENDTRIHDAALARYSGNIEEYKRIFREIQKEGKFSFDDIMSAVNSEVSAIEKKLEPDKATSQNSTGDFVEAVVMGNTINAEAMRDDIIAAKVANGKTQEEAEKEFASNVGTDIGKAYSSGLLDETQAEKLLVEYAGKDEEEAASRVNYWVFCEEHQEYKDVLTEANVNDYQEFAEPAEISLDVYAQYISGTKGLETIKDEWGDVEVSKRDQVLEVIDSLPITRKQKDALYLAAGYSESKIWDVPW